MSTYAVLALAILLALLAHELDAPCREEGAAGGRVAHFYEAGVEVDLGGEGRDGDQGGGADAEDGRDRLVEEALVAVGGLFQYQDVAAGALGGPDLHRERTESVSPEESSAFLYKGTRVSTFWFTHVWNSSRIDVYFLKHEFTFIS